MAMWIAKTQFLLKGSESGWYGQLEFYTVSGLAHICSLQPWTHSHLLMTESQGHCHPLHYVWCVSFTYVTCLLEFSANSLSTYFCALTQYFLLPLFRIPFPPLQAWQTPSQDDSPPSFLFQIEFFLLCLILTHKLLILHNAFLFAYLYMSNAWQSTWIYTQNCSLRDAWGGIAKEWRQSTQRLECTISLGPENDALDSLRCLWCLFWTSTGRYSLGVSFMVHFFLKKIWSSFMSVYNSPRKYTLRFSK